MSPDCWWEILCCRKGVVFTEVVMSFNDVGSSRLSTLR